MKLFLIGDPVAHSISPAMQNAAFSALGLDHHYEALRVPADRLSEAVERLRAEDVLGANVTIPHKLDIFPLVDVREEAAVRVRALNTIFKRASALHGDNTDGGGFADALAECGVDVSGRRVLLLGAGGAARACLDHLISAGAQIDVVDRKPERAVAMGQEMVGLFRDQYSDGRIDSTIARARQKFSVLAAPPRSIEGYDVLVNATSVGMHGEEALQGITFPGGLAVVDIVATAAETPLVKRARAAGCVVVDGLLMLLHQGTRAFKLWTGVEAPVDVMRAALPRRV